jgi:hypothetical protein
MMIPKIGPEDFFRDCGVCAGSTIGGVFCNGEGVEGMTLL